MTTSRLAISLDSDLAEQIRAAAGDGTVSGWLAEAAERRLRSEGLQRVVDEWEAQHGAFTKDELDAAERELRPKRRR